jgi:hypothetical protein
MAEHPAGDENLQHGPQIHAEIRLDEYHPCNNPEPTLNHRQKRHLSLGFAHSHTDHRLILWRHSRNHQSRSSDLLQRREVMKPKSQRIQVIGIIIGLLILTVLKMHKSKQLDDVLEVFGLCMFFFILILIVRKKRLESNLTNKGEN